MISHNGSGRHKQIPKLRIEKGDDAGTPEGLSSEVETWERQPKESEPAWEAFKTYRDLGKERSQRRVAETVRKNEQLIKRWSKRWQWNLRAYDYELHLDRIARAEAAREVGAMAKRHAAQAQLYMAALSAPATALMQRIQQDPQFMNKLLSACEEQSTTPGAARTLNVDKTLAVMDTLRKFAEAFPKIAQTERLARGEPTDILKHEGNITNEQAAKEGALARAVFSDPETAEMASKLFEKLNTTQKTGTDDA